MEYCDDDRHYVRPLKTDPFIARPEESAQQTQMDLLTPISRDQLKVYTEMPQHVRMILQRVIGEVYQAISSAKTSCLLESVVRQLQVEPTRSGFAYEPNPKFGLPAFADLLRLKFPGCKVEVLQDHWYEVDASTRKKVTGIKIDWS